eukprot:15442020-Alexandrium_andersonii.AAC.1
MALTRSNICCTVAGSRRAMSAPAATSNTEGNFFFWMSGGRTQRRVPRFRAPPDAQTSTRGVGALPD